MADQNRNSGKDHTGAETVPVPDTAQGQDPDPAPRPSQAEGDRETVEESIRQKEAEGEL